ncbi:C40 family peptidase [Moraxella nasovis]|uniref:C40 family peptidase n=1 Tax=Moraxella nasovis TaxID=2904121 RepID=UPI001F6043FC|nr:C40 family peptidase [Moraxella nasovis]UNU74100.1 C40 family peptidase [Moraxella nasovis]
MRITKKLKLAIEHHAKAEYPKECCGLVINGEYYPCDNVADNPNDTFIISPKDFIKYSSLGEIQAIVHSHPDGDVLPSELDRVQMAVHDTDWLICAISSDNQFYIKSHKPKAYTAPLLGREYHHGVQDCYSLVRDYYERELGITLPDFDRTDAWWENQDHKPLYQDNFKKAGFVQIEIDELQKHDVILCYVGRTHHINHALIYLDDGKLTSEKTPPTPMTGLVLHHPYGTLSVRELYGETWRKRTALVVRHKQFAV